MSTHKSDILTVLLPDGTLCAATLCKAVPVTVPHHYETLAGHRHRVPGHRVDENRGDEHRSDEHRVNERPPVETPSVNEAPAADPPPVAPPFYSKLQRVIEEKMGARAAPREIGRLVENAGVPRDELAWSGLNDFLGRYAENSGPVEKSALLEHLRAHQPYLDEVVKQGPNRTRYAKYVLPGGRNYAEMLFVLPDLPLHIRHRFDELRAELEELRDPYYAEDPFAVEDDPASQAPPMPKDVAERVAWLENEIQKINQQRTPYDQRYRSKHWDDDNVLAHVRFDERTDREGRRVLFLEEMQSDWHQDGRKNGYAAFKPGELPSDYTITKVSTPLKDGSAFNEWEVKKTDGALVSRLAAGAWSYEDVVDYVRDLAQSNFVPPAPYSKTWHEWIMRRMLRYAAENGFDALGWATGAQNNERYDLSKEVDKISYQKPDRESGVEGAFSASKNGRELLVEWGLPPEKLEEFVGKEVAERLLAQEPDHDGAQHLSGQQLQVGGQGMRTFYDRILPQYINKYTRRWGTVAQTLTIKTPGYGDNDDAMVHGVVIPPTMAHSLLHEGQPLFKALGPKALWSGTPPINVPAPLPEAVRLIEVHWPGQSKRVLARAN